MKSLTLALILSMLLVLPLYAAPLDLTTYTSGGGYVTPAYGKFLQGYYYYSYGGVDWELVGENYETLGYYTQYNSLVDSSLNINAQIKASFAGVVYLCVKDSNNAEICQLLDSYNNVGNYQIITGTYDLNANGVSSGRFQYYLRLVYNIGGNTDSWPYTGYYNLESAYRNKRTIAITSTNNLSSGVITLTLNSTITLELESTNTSVIYDTDGSEQSYSGTFSTLEFTNEAGTKVYPYYIDTWKGGFYNYSRNSTNTTTIKIFVGEDVTTKGLIMYYNITPQKAVYSLEGYYNFNGRTDENNNPFVIDQIFNDMRWTESFYSANIDNFTKSGFDPSYCTYSRYVAIYAVSHYPQSGTGCQMNPKFLNNISSLYSVAQQDGPSHSTYNVSVDFGQWYRFEKSSPQIINFYNSSLSNISNGNAMTNTVIYSISVKNENGLSYLNMSLANFTLNESNPNHKLIGVTVGADSCISGCTPYIRRYNNINNISSTNTISSSQNTTPINTSSTLSISINSNTPTDTLINIIPVQIDLSTNLAGVLSCFNYDTNISFGTIAIPATNTTETYNIIFNYEYTNQTEFLTLNETRYYCTYTTGGNVYTSGSYMTFFGTDKLYLSNVNPTNYYNYPNNAIPHSANFSYNYSTTYHSTLFNVFLSNINCNRIYQNKCLDWDFGTALYYSNETYCIFGICVPIKSGYTNPTSYSDNSIGATLGLQSGKCYFTGYIINIANESAIYNNLLIHRVYCINAADNTTSTNQTSQQQNQNQTINNILNFFAGCSSTNQTCLNEKLYSNPLLAIDYMLITVFNGIVGAVSPNNPIIALFDLLVIGVGNYYTLCVILGILAAYYTKQNPNCHKIGIGIAAMFFMVFSYFNWTGIPILLEIIVIILSATLYIWKSKR